MNSTSVFLLLVFLASSYQNLYHSNATRNIFSFTINIIIIVECKLRSFVVRKLKLVYRHSHAIDVDALHHHHHQSPHLFFHDFCFCRCCNILSIFYLSVFLIIFTLNVIICFAMLLICMVAMIRCIPSIEGIYMNKLKKKK